MDHLPAGPRLLLYGLQFTPRTSYAQYSLGPELRNNQVHGVDPVHEIDGTW